MLNPFTRSTRKKRQSEVALVPVPLETRIEAHDKFTGLDPAMKLVVKDLTVAMAANGNDITGHFIGKVIEHVVEKASELIAWKQINDGKERVDKLNEMMEFHMEAIRKLTEEKDGELEDITSARKLVRSERKRARPAIDAGDSGASAVANEDGVVDEVIATADLAKLRKKARRESFGGLAQLEREDSLREDVEPEEEAKDVEPEDDIAPRGPGKLDKAILAKWETPRY